MKFSSFHLTYFGAEAGAASIVTETEARDPQITLDLDEKEVVFSVIPEDRIFRGPKSADPIAATKRFVDHLTGDELEMPLVYPKGAGGELRLYNSKQTGFHPKAGDVWYVYRKQGRLYIGSMKECQWRGILVEDREDDILQRAIETGTNALITTEYLSKRYTRNPAMSRLALGRVGHVCEYDSSAALFISRSTGRPYVEAHHLVPLFATEQLGGGSLDVLDNIISLSPHWHRAIHHAEVPLVGKILEKLHQNRAGFLESLGLSLPDLLEIYGGAPMEDTI